MLNLIYKCGRCEHERKWGRVLGRGGFTLIEQPLLLCEGNCPAWVGTVGVHRPHSFVEYEHSSFTLAEITHT